MAVVNCDCKHTFQDKVYGPGKRYANRVKQSTGVSARCTVCDRVHTVREARR